MFLRLATLLLALGLTGILPAQAADKDPNLLGLPELKIPANNPMSPEKVALGERLYNDTRFSSTGKIKCATCHEPSKGFTDRLAVSKGINNLTGTRSSPTVANAAFSTTQFWDGRSPDLEDQALHPFTNPVEMGLPNHEPILKIVREDKTYADAFKQVFNLEPDKITILDVTKAIAAFERTQLYGNSKFDRWFYGGEANAMNAAEVRGYQAFIGNGRCVSCHVIEQTNALFTDNKFHNIGIGINRVPKADLERISTEFLQAQYDKKDVDVKVLTDKKSSELGRFAVTRHVYEMGGFKTPTLRNVDLTAPYMHDGSLKTLDEVVEHYNRGGASSEKEKAMITPFLSGGIRPLNLTVQEKRDIVAFLKALTSPKLVAKK